MLSVASPPDNTLRVNVVAALTGPACGIHDRMPSMVLAASGVEKK